MSGSLGGVSERSSTGDRSCLKWGSSNGHCVAMVAHTGALRRTFETPHDPSHPRSQGPAEWWDSLMFMTTDARVRSSWVTFEPASASCSGQPHRQGAPPLE